MELHPDRNYGNVEATTLRFADVQSAYSVLSDPQERAWYDSHRHSIMRDGSEPSNERSQQNSSNTTVEDILGIFARFNGRVPFTDSASGFFGGLRATFENLVVEETAASERQALDPVAYPSFGYAEDEYENTVRQFYASWSGFSTRKAFSWRELYRLSDAPDRRIRRMMEKENKRVREEAINEFNDCIRSLVAFIRKRDPRHKSITHGEAERQRILRDAASAQAARSRAANRVKVAQKTEVPVWTREVECSEIVQTDEEVDEVEDEVHCVVCKKTFKSEKQYESHERSKKHIKAVNQIRSTMKHEHNALGLSGESNSVAVDPNGPGIATAGATGEYCQDDSGGKDLLENVTGFENYHENDLNDTCYSNANITHCVTSQIDNSSTPRNHSTLSTMTDECSVQEMVEETACELKDMKLVPDPATKGLSERLSGENLEQHTAVEPLPKIKKAKRKKTRKLA